MIHSLKINFYSPNFEIVGKSGSEFGNVLILTKRLDHEKCYLPQK